MDHFGGETFTVKETGHSVELLTLTDKGPGDGGLKYLRMLCIRSYFGPHASLGILISDIFPGMVCPQNPWVDLENLPGHHQRHNLLNGIFHKRYKNSGIADSFLKFSSTQKRRVHDLCGLSAGP